MLEHEEQQNSAGQTGQAPISSGSKVSPADSARVTAEEFSAAILAIEQRKASDAEHHAGTVELGETIRELNIDATPEQILAEVLAERTRKAEQERARTDVKAKARKTASDAWDYASAAYETIRQRLDEASTAHSANHPIPVRVNVRAKVRSRSHRSPVRLIFIAFMIWCIWPLATGHQIGVIDVPFLRDLIRPATPGIVTSLATAPAGQTVYSDTGNLLKVINGGGTVSGSAGAAQVMTNHLDNSWPLIRHDGKVYVQGYVLKGAADKLSSGVTDIYNDADSGELYGNADSPVTIPLAGLKLDSHTQQDGWSEMVVEHVKVDSFTQTGDE